MRKLLAVVKREYVQRLRSRMFILITILGPVVMSLFAVAPALILSIRAGGPTRIAVVDQTGKLYQSVYDAVMLNARTPNADASRAAADSLNANTSERMEQMDRRQQGNFALEELRPEGKSVDEIKRMLDARVAERTLDGYLILPANLLEDGRPEYYGRNTGDLFARRFLQDALSRAVNQQRLADANIDIKIVRDLSEPVKLDAVKIGTGGGVRDSGQGFALVFGTGFIMYLTILLYGQMTLGAVIEEKETRLAEILFSSMRPFTLMMGKLIGISLVALSQLTIWGLAFVAFAALGGGILATSGSNFQIPDVPLEHFLYFGLYFLLGYFIYSTIYALIGSMVSTAQEGGQLSMPIVMLPLVGFYLFLPVSRSPDSSFAFWVSMFPFFSPMTMMVRIVTQTPPFWQISLSLLLGFGTVALIAWVAARVYRIGMLMTGKKASIPEVMRWIKQS